MSGASSTARRGRSEKSLIVFEPFEAFGFVVAFDAEESVHVFADLEARGTIGFLEAGRIDVVFGRVWGVVAVEPFIHDGSESGSGDGPADCMALGGFGSDVLKNPEPGFFILGSKSYGKNSAFLMRTGYEQVNDVMGLLEQTVRRYSSATV